MGNTASAEEPPAPDELATEHLVVFCHGLTSSVSASDLRHGRALAEALPQVEAALREGAELYASSANAGGSGAATLAWTTRCGVEEGGRLLAEEVRGLIANRPRLRRLSFVGASLGGLFVRYAVGLLVPDSLPATVAPHALVTLATPHLGVRGLISSRLIGTGRQLGMKTPADLDFKSDVMSNMSELGSAHMEALGAFAVRVAYAPIPDDGVVAWSTAALTGQDAPPPQVVHAAEAKEEAKEAGGVAAAAKDEDEDKDGGGGVEKRTLVSEHSIGVDMTAEDWIGVEDEAYFVRGRPGQSKRQPMWESLQNLHSVRWRVVSVNMPHKELATLYPFIRKTEREPNPATMEVANDVLRRVLSV